MGIADSSGRVGVDKKGGEKEEGAAMVEANHPLLSF